MGLIQREGACPHAPQIDMGRSVAASAHVWEGVRSAAGSIDVSIVRGSPILNGIEIHRLPEKTE